MNSGRADGPVLHSLVISQGESRIQDRLSPIQLTVVCSRQDSLKADVGPTLGRRFPAYYSALDVHQTNLM